MDRMDTGWARDGGTAERTRHARDGDAVARMGTTDGRERHRHKVAEREGSDGGCVSSSLEREQSVCRGLSRVRTGWGVSLAGSSLSGAAVVSGL